MPWHGHISLQLLGVEMFLGLLFSLPTVILCCHDDFILFYECLLIAMENYDVLRRVQRTLTTTHRDGERRDAALVYNIIHIGGNIIISICKSIVI